MAKTSSTTEVNVPPSLIWWRAQLRLRRAAAEQVSTPVTIAQLFAWAISLVAAVGLVISQHHHGLRWGSWFADLTPDLIRLSPMFSSHLDWNLVVVIPTIGALAVVAGLVVFLVSEKS